MLPNHPFRERNNGQHKHAIAAATLPAIELELVQLAKPTPHHFTFSRIHTPFPLPWKT
jgi:hypothetical protein